MDETVQKKWCHEIVHVVLVEPQESLNVGSVCRVMANLGFSHLRLVAPREYDPKRAAITACWATHLLEGLTIYDSLSEALSDMEEVVGFTGRGGRNRVNLQLLQSWNEQYHGDPLRTTALLFGPEDTGLTDDHLSYCRTLVRIPSDESCPSFNLSHAVALALYELSRDSHKTGTITTEGYPTWNEFFQLERIISEIATKVEFYREGTPAPVPDIVNNLFKRTSPTDREMGILLGLFSRVNKCLTTKRNL